MPRKENKLRPYRVDFFDVDEMKDYDLALVRSQVVRAVTADDAVYEVLTRPEDDSDFEYPSLVLIRAYRYYKNLVHKKDVYKAVEDLFTANKAVQVMEAVENYRKKKAEWAAAPKPVVVPISTDPAGHVTRISDSSLYDEVCVNCGATDTSGKLDQPCPSAPAIVPAPPAPTSGPDSPATVAVVADLQGMIAHDAHEQAMDTFKPDSVPEGKRFPDPTNAPITEQPTAVAEQAGRAPTSWTYGIPGLPEPAIEPDQAVGAEARPPLNSPMPDASDDYMPLWGKLILFGSVLLLALSIIHYLRH
jgi:hypothetical protein